MAESERWGVFKNYITEAGDNCEDTWVVIYPNKAEADAAMASLKAGQDPSWFKPEGDDQAFLYVEKFPPGTFETE